MSVKIVIALSGIVLIVLLANCDAKYGIKLANFSLIESVIYPKMTAGFSLSNALQLVRLQITRGSSLINKDIISN